MTDDTGAGRPPAAASSPREPSLLDALIPLVHADRAHRPDDRPLRDRRDERAVAGRAADECHGRRPGRLQEWLHRLAHPRGGDRGRVVRDERPVHPPRGRSADRDMEHGRHHPDRRLLRPRAAERDLVLPRDGDRLRPRRARDRQLLDDGGDARRGLRRARPAGRSRSGHRGRGRHLGRLLRRQDDAGLGDDGPRAVHGRRRDDQSSTSAR